MFTRAAAVTTLAAGLTTVGITAANAAMHYAYWEPSYFHCKVQQWSVLAGSDATLVQDCTESNGQWYFTTNE
jgi:hypothetical protein